jgi:hypothetical protein
MKPIIEVPSDDEAYKRMISMMYPSETYDET